MPNAPDFYPNRDEEIDLVDLVQTIWEGKWKVVSSVLAALVLISVYQLFSPPPTFTATTEIKPILSDERDLYRFSNAVGFFEVTPSLLERRYIEQLEAKALFEDAIRRAGLVKREGFIDEQFYNESVIALASSIEILQPINVDGAEEGESRRFWTIKFQHHDLEGWGQVLTDVNAAANESVKRQLQLQFQTLLAVARQDRQFRLDDLGTQIVNAIEDYDRKTSDRLAFLREQASIARTLDIANNTIEAQIFSAQNGMVANIETKTPFYMRGYEAIEKEIELVESRENKRAFAAGLLELEHQKRAIEQDRTLERAERLFATTPIISGDRFSAVSVKVEATSYEFKEKRLLLVSLAVVLGGMLGIMYVLLSGAIQKRSVA